METQIIKELLDKYWAGESTLEQESQIRAYFEGSEIDSELMQYKPLFNFYGTEKNISLERSIDTMLPKQETKIFTINRIRAIAATVLVVVASIFGFNYLQTNTGSGTNNTIAVEVQDPEEAYALTMEALSYLSSNYEKGSGKLKKLPEALESTIIFK